MSDEVRAPRGGTEWGAVNDALHALGNMITVRSHYTAGHPAISQADDNASTHFTRVLESIPDLVIALVDEEFIVCERPLPNLESRLHALADSMRRHDIECIVFQRGLTRPECGIIGAALAMPVESKGYVRENTQGELMHVLLRFVVRAGDTAAGAGTAAANFVPPVSEALAGVARALATDSPIDKLGILAIANQLVIACQGRTASLQQRSWTRSMEDEGAHAANVAMITATLALEAGYPQRVCIDATAAAMLHDIGHLFLPDEIRGVPDPLLDERARPVFRNHTFAGAQMLLGAGCSPLWVAAAFEHHRGVDSGGYPALEEKDPPTELIRIIALANYYDSKRTLVQGKADSPEEALRGAMELEARYFGQGLIRRFLRSLGVFPPGTVVELSNMEPAVVLRANPADPWRPQVKMLRGSTAGKIVELREMHPVEMRHRLSIVRAIAPPLLVLADAALKTPTVAPLAMVEEEIFTQKIPTPPPPQAAAKDAKDRARAQLGGMDAMLDALLTVPTDAFVSAMPPAPSGFPRGGPSYSPAPAPVITNAPAAMSRPPAQPMSRPPAQPMPVSVPAPVLMQPVPVQPAPMPAASPRPPTSPPVAIPASMPRTGMSRPPTSQPIAVPAAMPTAKPAQSRPPTSPPVAIPASMPRTGMSRPPTSQPISIPAAMPAASRPPVPPIVMTRPPPTGRPSQPGPLGPSSPSSSGGLPDLQEVERQLLARLGSVRSVPVLIADPTKLNVDHRAAFVLRFTDGMSTIDDILDASGLPRIDALRILNELLAARVIAMK